MPAAGREIVKRPLRAAGIALAWMLFVVACVAFHALVIGMRTVPRGDFEGIEEHLTRQLAAPRHGSAVLVLIRNGRIATQAGFGTANAETGAPPDPDRTLYVVASVSKAVTAAGVLRLVEDGRLALDEPVARYLTRWRFPDGDAYGDQVTVRHLLSHTAGLDDGLGYNGFGPNETLQSLEESLSGADDSSGGTPRAVRVSREPGAAMSYSGGGYTVLQLVVEEVTGRAFSDAMREVVLEPAGMTSATFDSDVVVSERPDELAAAFGLDGSIHPPRRYTAEAAVGLHATAVDLARFLIALHDGTLLRRDTLEEMSTPQAATGGTWGLGLTLYCSRERGDLVVGHDGGTRPGWGAVARINRATGNGIVLTSSGAGVNVSQVADQWTYWETGVVRPEARRQIIYDDLPFAAIAIVAGALVIVWNELRKKRETSS